MSRPDYALSSTIYVLFTSRNFSTGAPFLLSGTPTVDVYKDVTAAPIQTGISVTASLNTVTGLNAFTITASTANGYAAGNDYSVVLSGASAVNGVSVVGEVVFSFSIENQYSSVAAINGDAAAAANLAKTTAAVLRGTVAAGGSTTSVPTSAFTMDGSAATGVVADQFVGRTIMFDATTTTAGLRGATKTISASTASNTPTFTVGTLPATPASGDTFSVI
jgi:hypothetical protein